MSKPVYRSVVAAVVVALVVAVVALKAKTPNVAASTPPRPTPANPAKALPSVLDFGRGKCTMCKMMMPIMAELKQEYAGRVHFEVIDIDEQPQLTEKYAIELIPTQVFLSAKGDVLFKHEGFMPKEDIVAKLREAGLVSGGG